MTYIAKRSYCVHHYGSMYTLQYDISQHVQPPCHVTREHVINAQWRQFTSITAHMGTNACKSEFNLYQIVS